MGEAKAVAVMNLKGGVGKTTLAIILAHINLVKHKKTICIDIDPQKNFTYGMSFVSGEPSFKPLLQIKDSIDDDDENTPEDTTIIIDCPPALGAEKEGRAIEFADIMLIPVRPDRFSMQNLDKLYAIAEGHGKDKNQLPLVKIGFDNSVIAKQVEFMISQNKYPVAGSLQLDRRIPRNITDEERIWCTGLAADTKKPYFDLYESIFRAYKRMRDDDNFDGAWLN